jgi:hypothetical protein
MIDLFPQIKCFFLAGYPVPENLFNALRVDKSIDRFSWIVDDIYNLKVLPPKKDG